MVTDIFNQTFKQDFALEEVQKIKGRLYDFVPASSRRLFVSIGDSWTYGARLAEEDANNDQYRVSHCYGALASQALGADFLNLAVPGINNLWMINKYLQLVNIADLLEYDCIDVFVTLTESGREIGTDFDLDPILNDGYRQATTPRQVAQALANYEADRILANQHPKVKLHLGCNYVTNIYPESLQSFFVPRTWLEVLLDRNIEDECFVVGSWVIPKYRDMLSYNSDVDQSTVLQEMTDMIERGQRRLDLVYNTGFNYRTGYGHPNTQGHAKWASYILSQFNGNKG
jgi:hypothetical protein